MRVALLNPPWRFEGSIYFGCRAPHLPLELACAQRHLQARGHPTLMLDGHLFGLDEAGMADQVRDFLPEMIVVTTAPSYLFWRCAQPELTVPRRLLDRLRDIGAVLVADGPHGSTTPRAALHKLGAHVVLRGECDEAVAELADAGGNPSDVAGAAWGGGINGGPRSASFTNLPPLHWPDAWIACHHHHHHRFDAPPEGPGAEVEASRGCPYSSTFCAKTDFRDRYRRRALSALLQEIDALIAQGVTYLYFIDEIFLPQRALLEALAARQIKFGVQTRIDLWKPDLLDLLGAAGCVSIEAGIESLTPEGRAALDKSCKLETDQLAALLTRARQTVPFVQANLIKSAGDEPERIAEWRSALQRQGVWANDPVPLFPYPASPDYRRLWGEPDDDAWERAHAHYLDQFAQFSDIQEERPRPLPELEAPCRC